ncbi:MAG: PLP-dependent aminotransferase family protein [Desulfosarcinaceae bacterium]|jgi:DNA-binding transcriptional MocR family regulator
MTKARYQAIAQTIRDRIAAGLYPPGERIPSIRRFAEAFGCNKLTVQHAFETLKREGVIENRVGSGSYVRFPERVDAPEGIFDFHTDYLDESFFPYQRLQVIINGLFEADQARALAPTPAAGDPGLIRVLSRFYHVPAGQMIVVSGAQQGLDLVAKMFAADIAEALLFEDPTYPGAISLFKPRHFIALEKDGPDLEQLEAVLDRTQIRLLYAMPTVHNPTGTAYSAEKKTAIAKLARHQGFYIVEDDYLGELRPEARERFIDICPEQTIYVKSLSQTTVAGIRLGFMVVPRHLFDKGLYVKFASDIGSIGLMQRAMGAFFEQGDYQNHLARVAAAVARRRSRLVALIDAQEHLKTGPDQAGYSLWIRSERPSPLATVPWRRGADFSFSPEVHACFRLSFMHMDDDTFEKGLEHLNRLWR